jgi:hypothetical protein
MVHGVVEGYVAGVASVTPGPEADSGEWDVCFVCLEGRRDAVLLECGHGGLCVPCAQVRAVRGEG